MAKTDNRPKITLACTECKRRNYNTVKNRVNDRDRIELKKYCRWCRRTPCTARRADLGRPSPFDPERCASASSSGAIVTSAPCRGGSQHDRVELRVHPELREHVLRVRAKGVLAHPELGSDLLGRSPSAMRWRISSSRGVSRSRRCTRLPPSRVAGAGAAATHRPRGSSIAAPPVGPSDRVGELDDRLGLGQVAASAGLERAGERDVVGPARQDDHRRAGGLVVDSGASPRCRPCRAWQIHQDDVGVLLGRPRSRLARRSRPRSRGGPFLLERQLEGSPKER